METPRPRPGPDSTGSPAGRIARSLLWGLFGLLVLAGGWLFLRACGTYPVLGFARDFCPIPADHRALGREVETGERLRRAIHLAEMRVAETPACAPPAPVPPRTPAPVPAEQQRQTRQIDRRVEERGGKRGTLQLTLVWQTRDDLDLNLFCPGGLISSYDNQRGPGICGDGVKDLDANRNATGGATTNPVENITFPTAPPAGAYKIEVIEYRAFAQDTDNSVPFTLRIRWNGEERICRDSVSTTPLAQQLPALNGRPVGGSARLLLVDLDKGLPDCTFEAETTYRGAADK